MKEDKKIKCGIEKSIQQSMMAVFVRVSSWIVFPVIFGAFLGKYLDVKYETGNLWLLTVIGFSFLISMIGVVKETNMTYKRILKKAEEKKEHDKN